MGYPGRGGMKVIVPPWLPFARERVRYVGDPVVATAILDRAGHAPKQEIDMRADVKTTRTDTAPIEDLEAQLLRLATARPAADGG